MFVTQDVTITQSNLATATVAGTMDAGTMDLVPGEPQ